MKIVSEQSIEKAILKIDSFSEEGLEKWMDEHGIKQQNLVGYILQAGLEYENEELNLYIIYYFAIIYEAFLQEGIKMQIISEEAIDEFQEPFLDALDAIHKDENHEPLHELVGQLHLQQFMAEELEAQDEDGIELTDDTKSQLFIVSSAIIGLLNEASVN